ncbi:SUMF1/EgtB/PvdO family nonheme iron enzyme [Microbacterium maritypicum]|uniref:formylglycine-generating enzyme family protein n=1 Tax=Microbacterium TaxID=33882 RepID=UPI001424204C|nr:MULTISPECIES: SUMF1/EgtB/PvdO family nonheme iron enzyme [Microbacterium]NIG63655.1 SUMF1/EgtB/PvdO family nonheme iron enzyme [Microbacterium sp. Be9]
MLRNIDSGPTQGSTTAVRVSAAVALTLGLVATSTTPAFAQSPMGRGGADAAHRALDDLEESLVWRSDAKTTYGAVVPAVNEAILALDEDRSRIPQYESFKTALERLQVESTYLLDLATQPGYQPGVLDSVMFLQGSVAEWQYRVASMDDSLKKRDKTRPARVEGSRADVSAQTQPGTVFRDLPGLPEMVVVPKGDYVAGATAEEQQIWNVPENRRDFETPQRDVTISEALAFGTTEVTVGQFSAFVKETKYRPRGGARWWNPQDPSAMQFNAALDYLNPGFPQTTDSPVVAITREDANAYASWLSAKTGETYRLPSEDEWEWAARGGATTTFYWGDDLSRVNEYANSFDLSSKETNGFGWDSTGVDDGYPYTAPVASFAPNGYGLYDVTGNAREFVADDWVQDLSAAANDGSPHDGGVPFPVVRGGAWNYQPQNLRLDYRSAYYSSETATNMFGFRLVRVL